MQPNVLIGPGTKTYVPNLSSQLAFMSIGSLVRFSSVFFFFGFFFFFDSFFFVKEPTFFFFFNFFS